MAVARSFALLFMVACVLICGPQAEATPDGSSVFHIHAGWFQTRAEVQAAQAVVESAGFHAVELNNNGMVLLILDHIFIKRTDADKTLMLLENSGLKSASVFTVELESCRTEVHDSEVRLTELNNGSEVTVHVGDSLRITLNANPATGYQWMLSDLDGDMLAKLGNWYMNDPGKSGLAGAGGQEVWQFVAAVPGTAYIALDYKRPWEEDTPPAKEFGITVQVLEK